jgi:2,3-diketo-5-methylthiopentyl-1-phosphate enolase
MYTRYYDPDIFQHTLDGIDRSTHIVATYYMDDEMPGEDFIDHFSLVQETALDGSTGTWEKIAEDTAEVRKKLSGKLVGYYEVPSGSRYRRQAVVQLAFPIDAWTDNVAMMMLSISGNCFAFSPKLRLLDLAMPDELLKKFQGPKLGIPGVRARIGVPERPLSVHIIKPKMGMPPALVAQQCYQTAMGGVDMIKDDEMTSDVYNSSCEDRLKAVLDALETAKAKTGKAPVYFLSITDDPKRIFDKASRAAELGATGFLVSYSVGLGVLRQLAEMPNLNVPIMVHPAHMIAAQPRISWPVFAKLVRTCGADLMLTPTFWSSIPMVSLEEGLRTAQVKVAPYAHIKPTWPMPCGGAYPGLVPLLVGEYGPDIAIPAGGGMLGHPDGYTAGAAAWQQAIAATMSGEDFIEYARKPSHRELRRALERWGSIERPKTPWFRASPKFHPKPMKLEESCDQPSHTMA